MTDLFNAEHEAAEPDLTLEQLQHLMAARREMRQLGYGLISLRELMGEIADETTSAHVLRSGEYVGRHRAPEWPADDVDEVA